MDPNYKEPSDPVIFAERLDIVKALVIKGLLQREIVRHCLEKYPDWDVSDRWLREMVHKAKDQLTDEARRVDRAAEFAIAKGRNDLVFRRAMEVSDFKTALAANLQNMRLMRLDRPNADFDWKEAARQAGIDPKSVMAQFVETLDMAGVAQDDAAEPD